MDIIEYIKDNILIFDGAMGTMLQRKGLKQGENSSIFGFKNKKILLEVHKEYLNAGANVITTNTFRANEIVLDKLGYKVEDIVDSAVKIAKLAIEESDKSIKRYIALSVGPIGEMLEPIGKISFDRAYEIFKRQMIKGEESGADVILIETMIDLCEAKSAVLAAKENTNLPVFLTMTFDKNGKSFTGCTPEELVHTMQELGVDAVGINCSYEPKKIMFIVEKICKASNIPVIVQANAGLPNIINDNVIYNINEDEYIDEVNEFIKKGVSIIGGCCGTTPILIEKIRHTLSNIRK